MSGFDSKQDYDEGRADDELLRPYVPGRDRPRAPLPPPVIREQLAEEMAKVRRDGSPPMWDIDRDDRGYLHLTIIGLGTIKFPDFEAARQLGSALLAEVEIATRKDIE